MPQSPPTRCGQPGCGRLVATGSRCEDHRRRAWENTSRRNQLIDKGRWARTARAHLRREPGCRVCGSTLDVQVDHVLEISDSGALYDDENCQTLCPVHHEAKTAAQRAARVARRRPGPP